MEQGTVIKSTGSWYELKTDSGDLLKARIKGKFRLNERKETNPLAVGDHVMFTRNEEGIGVIEERCNRKNYVARQSPRKKHDVHIIASNIDQAVLITTLIDPDLKLGFVDRFLLMLEPYEIPAIIVVNKSDLWDEGLKEMFYGFEIIYKNIGYEVISTSIKTGDGIEQLTEKLTHRISLIGGQSGVGKSSLVNMIAPELDLRTQVLSEYSGKGQHTTTFAEMHELPFGGALIDTPGIKTLSFNQLEAIDVAHNFREFFVASEHCKFGANCQHRKEPGCEVIRLIDEGLISPTRYESYLAILSEIEAQNYWERKKNI